MTLTRDDDIARRLARSRALVGSALDELFEQEVGDYGVARGVDRATAVAIGHRANSVAQGNKSRGGAMLERLVLDEFDKACDGRASFTRQWNMPGFQRCPMDGYLETAAEIWVVSVARSTRERKVGTWNNEFRLCQKHAAEVGKPLRFLAVTDDLKASEVEHIRGKVTHGVQVVWLPNRDATRQILSEISESVQ